MTGAPDNNPSGSSKHRGVCYVAPMDMIAIWFGGLIPTLLLSRLTLLPVKPEHRGRPSRLLVAHAIAFALCVLLLGFTDGEGGIGGRIANMFGDGLVSGARVYALPQIFWFILEWVWRAHTALQEVRVEDE